MKSAEKLLKALRGGRIHRSRHHQVSSSGAIFRLGSLTRISFLLAPAAQTLNLSMNLSFASQTIVQHLIRARQRGTRQPEARGRMATGRVGQRGTWQRHAGGIKARGHGARLRERGNGARGNEARGNGAQARMGHQGAWPRSARLRERGQRSAGQWTARCRRAGNEARGHRTLSNRTRGNEARGATGRVATERAVTGQRGNGRACCDGGAGQ